MKKYLVALAALLFVVSVAIIAHALHDTIIPYESTFGHYEAMPLADAGDLRHHIISHMPYRKAKEFTLWPGKGEKYKGTEPHGALLTTYVNQRALKSIKAKKGMANNSIIIKENYTSNKKLMAVTVMYKVKGYNRGGGDWFWVKYDADFNTLKQGKVKGCLNCHGTVKDNDYIYTGKVTGK